MSKPKEGRWLVAVLGALLVAPPLWYGTVALLQVVGFFVYGKGDVPAWADWLFDVLPLSVTVLSSFAGAWVACWATGKAFARRI